LAKERDIVVGRRGDSLTGKLREKHFEIKSDFGKVRVPTKKIAWIHFKNPPRVESDEIWLAGGDRLTGTISRKSISFEPDAGETLKIPCKAILTLIVGARMGRGDKSLLSG
jgi:hypothetical protein